MSALSRLGEQLTEATPGEWVFSWLVSEEDGRALVGIVPEGGTWKSVAADLNGPDAALIVSLRNCAEELLAVAEAANLVKSNGVGLGELHAALAALEVQLAAQENT